MTEPELNIIGIYRPQVSAETWQEQLQVTGDEAYTKEHFDKLVLIEAVVDGLDEPFDLGEFGQMQAEFPDDPSPDFSGWRTEQIQFLLGHRSVETTERYLGSRQRIGHAVNDKLGIEPDAAPGYGSYRKPDFVGTSLAPVRAAI